MKARARWSLAYAAVAVLLTITACTVRAEPAPDPPRTVTATPTGFTLDGDPWWPSGMDAYQLATNWSINRGCGAQVDLDAYFAGLPPNALTRFDLFAALAVNKFTGAVDFRPADAVFAAAARHRHWVLPVLVGGDGACESGEFQATRLVRRRVEDGARVRGHDVPAVAHRGRHRWRGSPALAGWEPVGEPERVCGGRSCAFQTGPARRDAGSVLRGFFDAAGGAVRALDPGRLVFSDSRAVASAAVPATNYELVGPITGRRRPRLPRLRRGRCPAARRSVERTGASHHPARAVGKPIVVNEIGQNAGSCGNVDDRAADVRRKVAGPACCGHGRRPVLGVRAGTEEQPVHLRHRPR